MQNDHKPDLSVLREVLPPYVSRAFPKFTELIGFSPRTMANKDSVGDGPPKKIMIGNRIHYERESLITWLESQSRIIEPKPRKSAIGS